MLCSTPMSPAAAVLKEISDGSVLSSATSVRRAGRREERLAEMHRNSAD